MSRREKQYARLADLETELCSTLIRELEWCAASGNVFAFATRSNELNRQTWFKGRASFHLIDLVEGVEKLREGLREPPAPVCVRYRSFCAGIWDHEDEHRLGPKRLAQEFLRDIQADLSKVE